MSRIKRRGGRKTREPRIRETKRERRGNEPNGHRYHRLSSTCISSSSQEDTENHFYFFILPARTPTGRVQSLSSAFYDCFDRFIRFTCQSASTSHGKLDPRGNQRAIYRTLILMLMPGLKFDVTKSGKRYSLLRVARQFLPRLLLILLPSTLSSPRGITMKCKVLREYEN